MTTSAFKSCFDLIKTQHPDYTTRQCVRSAYELLTKQLKISRDVDDKERQSVYSPDKTLIGFIQEKTNNSPAMVPGVRYAYGYTTSREFIAWSLDNKVVSRSKVKKDALSDLVREVYHDEADSILKQNEATVHISQDLKMLIRETICEQKHSKIIIEAKSAVSLSNLKQSLNELSNAIADLESEGFWNEFADEDADEPDNDSEVWDDKIDKVIAAIDASDFNSIMTAAPELLNVAKIVIEIYKENDDQLNEDVLFGAQFAVSQLKNFMKTYKKDQRSRK
jgi:hypothetical protein